MGVALGIIRLDDPVAVGVEGAGVEQLVLGIELAAACVFGDEVVVRVLALRVVVAPAVPGVARQRVEVPPVLLRVLAVVALLPVSPKMRSLRIGSRPFQSASAEAEALLDVREAGESVLAPAVGTRTGVVVGEVVPGGAVRAVVLADGPPLALAQIRPPVVPVACLPQSVLETTERLDSLALTLMSSSVFVRRWRWRET